MIELLERSSDTSAVTKEQYERAWRYFRKNPMAYIDNVILPPINITLETNQREILEAIFKYKRVIIPTHHAFGKSFISAIVAITLLNLYCNDVKGITLAPTFRQVQDILWSEIRNIHERVNAIERVLLGKVNLTRYEIGAKAFAVGVSPRRAAKGAATPEFIQGTHARVVFVIGDEAGGLEPQIFEQIEGITNTAGEVYIIYIGNPLNAASTFGEMARTEKGEGFMVIHKTAYENTNMIANGLTSLEAIRKEGDRLRVMTREQRAIEYREHYTAPAPYLLSPAWVMACYIKWGESPLFFSKCIGEWAANFEDALVPLDRANECMYGSYIDADGVQRWTSEEQGVAAWDNITTINIGIDASGEGRDKMVAFGLRGNRQYYYKSFNKTWIKEDADFKGTRLKEDGAYIAKDIYDNIINANRDTKINILIDSTGGFGNSVYENLLKLKFNTRFITIRKVNFAEAAADKETYHDVVAEMAYMLAADIKSPSGLLLENNDDLKNQITSRKKQADAKLRNMLEPKDKYKQRAGQSPDDFDALMLANYGRHLNTINKVGEFSAHFTKNNKATTMANAIKQGVKKW